MDSGVPDRSLRVNRRAFAGGRTRTIFESRSTPEYGVVVNALAASPDQVLVQQALPDAFDAREVVGIGRDGRVEALGTGSVRAERQIDLSGNVGIYNGSEPGATIRDFGVPGSQPALVSPVSGQMRVAGRYAAWEDAGDIVVYDRTSESAVYRLRSVWPTLDDGRSLDLQADGKVAFYYQERSGGRERGRVAWASPAEPFAHRLPVRDDASYVVKMENDRVVFVRHLVRLFNRQFDLRLAFGELGAVGLTGREQILVRPVESGNSEEYFDYDNGRVAWQERSCRGAELVSLRVDALLARPRLPSKRPIRRCRMRFEGPARYLRRDGAVRLRGDCTGFRRDCFVQVTTVQTLRDYRVGGRPIRRGTRVSGKDFEGASSNVTELELTRTGRRLVSRPGRIRLGVRTLIGDSSSVERRRGRITLRWGAPR